MSQSAQNLRPDGLSLGRDLEITRQVLETWMSTRMADVRHLELSEIRVPGSSGSANETLLFDATWDRRGRREHQALVARIKPTTLGHHYQDHFEDEYRVLTLLATNTDVPVAKPHWYEHDPSLLGAPFGIYEQVDGLVPPDNPPFNTAGWVFEAAPSDRRRLWVSALEAMSRLHTCEPGDLGFLAPDDATPGLDQDLEQWRRANDWAAQGRTEPVVSRAFQWLSRNLPKRNPPSLSWGDARIGNMIFRDFECVAILDWDMVSLGGPKVDLGFWIFMEETWPGARLDGFGDRDDTIAIWEDRTALSAADIEWYEVFAGFRLAAALVAHARKVHDAAGSSDSPNASRPSDQPDYRDLASPARMFTAIERYL